VSTPSANRAVANAGRGSRPGLSSSARIVAHGGQPERGVGEPDRVQGGQRRAVAEQVVEAAAGEGQDPVHHGVRLGVHGGAVERVVAVPDPQEARALLEGLRPEPRDLAQRPAGAERPGRVAVPHDVLGEGLGDPRDGGRAAGRTRC